MLSLCCPVVAVSLTNDDYIRMYMCGVCVLVRFVGCRNMVEHAVYCYYYNLPLALAGTNDGDTASRRDMRACVLRMCSERVAKRAQSAMLCMCAWKVGGNCWRWVWICVCVCVWYSERAEQCRVAMAHVHAFG